MFLGLLLCKACFWFWVGRYVGNKIVERTCMRTRIHIFEVYRVKWVALYIFIMPVCTVKWVALYIFIVPCLPSEHLTLPPRHFSRFFMIRIYIIFFILCSNSCFVASGLKVWLDCFKNQCNLWKYLVSAPLMALQTHKKLMRTQIPPTGVHFEAPAGWVLSSLLFPRPVIWNNKQPLTRHH
jgi:hypothetical protein